MLCVLQGYAVRHHHSQSDGRRAPDQGGSPCVFEPCRAVRKHFRGSVQARAEIDLRAVY